MRTAVHEKSTLCSAAPDKRIHGALTGHFPVY